MIIINKFATNNVKNKIMLYLLRFNKIHLSNLKGIYFISTNSTFIRKISDFLVTKKKKWKIKKFEEYLLEIRKKPVSYVTTFLILHEITAIVPLFFFWYIFYKVDKFETLGLNEYVLEYGKKTIEKLVNEKYLNGVSAHEGSKIILSGSYSYLLTKILIPFRIVFSVKITPFIVNKIVDPIIKAFKKKN